MSYQSESNVLTATTFDIHVEGLVPTIIVAANASDGYAGKDWFGVKVAKSR